MGLDYWTASEWHLETWDASAGNCFFSAAFCRFCWCLSCVCHGLGFSSYSKAPCLGEPVVAMSNDSSARFVQIDTELGEPEVAVRVTSRSDQ